MLAALSEPDRTRLVRLLGMLGSDHQGERANAGALADRFIRERELTWEQVVASEGQQQSQSRTWHDVVADCQRQPARLSQWERGFLASISAWRGSLTRKQQAKLEDIAARLGVEPAT
jgi:hypothetical protein